jgi:O-Antigen ligase
MTGARTFDEQTARTAASVMPSDSPASRPIQGAAARLASPAVQAFLLAFVLVLVLAANDGGYAPPAWDWSALVLLLGCAIALAGRTRPRLGLLELAAPATLLVLAGWGLLSAVWSPSLTQPALESQRTLMYAAGVFAAVLIVRERSRRALLAGTWLAITLICIYSLLTRLFPERVGFIDTLAGYRLDQPLGYWNALGVFATIGALLALGFAARGKSVAVRALAAASTVPLVVTLYFTFSRGSWIALGAGLLTAVALDPRRLQLITGLLTVGPWPAIAVWRASVSKPLTRLGSGLSAQSHAGHHFALTLVELALVAAVASVAFMGAQQRLRVPRPARLAYSGTIVLAIVVALTLVTVRFGSPPTLASRLYHDFVGPPNAVQNGNLNTRLFSLSNNGRVPQWKVAWREYKGHPWLGGGYGSYERYWYEYRPYAAQVVNVHNLYLETLAELGPVGLGLLVLALCLPMVAAIKARRWPLASGALGAYVAFLVHASVDWDWQMPAVTLAALFCGVALLVSTRRVWPLAAATRPGWRMPAIALTLLLAGLAYVGLRGNSAIAASEAAANRSNWAAATADARAAIDWAPWSSRAWQLLGEVEIQQHKLGAARMSLRKAVEKDPADWSLWLDLAIASTGRERRDAVAEAAKLNPLSPEVAFLKPHGRRP